MVDVSIFHLYTDKGCFSIVPSHRRTDFAVVALMKLAECFCQPQLSRPTASHLIEVFNKHSELFRTYYRLMCL